MKYLNRNNIYLGRAEDKMLELEPSSVALSFWSPPYFVGKEYETQETFDSWQSLLKNVIENHAYALKSGGFMVINMANILCFKDSNIPKIQALNISNRKSKVTREMVLDAMQKYPEYNRYQLADLLGCSEQTIDRRLNGNNIRGGKYQTQTRVKLVGHYIEKYAYNVGIYLYDKRVWIKDPSWVNSQWTSNTLKAVDEHEDLYIFWKPGEYAIDRNKLSKEDWKQWGARGVWHIPSVRSNRDHPAKFPEELASRVIRLFSNPQDLVLDPFMGSGTTAIAAIKNNRDYIGIEKEAKYVELARNRIQEHPPLQRELSFM
ncbi:DNA-methyltransferase [Baaleninema simplex]|uniref:DNA-methyltransferase n=1 Tax=Baaleninema simplex TaxID=2862350 RepID=UPI000345C780|nr:site-specific DNA-methyltransferase [Baaleninema simplex]